MFFLSKAGLTYYHGKVKNLLADKVDKETGKGLSTNDYTDADKAKLAAVITDPSQMTAEQRQAWKNALQIKWMDILYRPTINGVELVGDTGGYTNEAEHLLLQAMPTSYYLPYVEGNNFYGTEVTVYEDGTINVYGDTTGQVPAGGATVGIGYCVTPRSLIYTASIRGNINNNNGAVEMEFSVNGGGWAPCVNNMDLLVQPLRMRNVVRFRLNYDPQLAKQIDRTFSIRVVNTEKDYGEFPYLTSEAITMMKQNRLEAGSGITMSQDDNGITHISAQ